MILSRHAYERYVERFGHQDKKVIIDRAAKAATVGTARDGREIRQWGQIQFLVQPESETIITILNVK